MKNMYQEREITPMLLFASFASVLGMYQLGFNTGVMNSPQRTLEDYIATVYKTRTGLWMSVELCDLLLSIIVSSFPFGAMIGSLLVPMLSSLCGPKTGLLLNNIIAILGTTLMSSSQLNQSAEYLLAGRFIIGINCGLSSALVPMYLSEIATTHIRGAIISIGQLGVALGFLSAQVLGLKNVLGSTEHWPLLFGFAFLPVILQLILLPFCPESPRYLLIQLDRLSEARVSLRRLRASSDIEHDIDEIRAEALHETEMSTSIELAQLKQAYGLRLSSIKHLFRQPSIRRPLMIVLIMQLSQQLSGIGAIFYYSTDIFLSAGLGETYSSYGTVAVGIIMVLTTLLSFPFMDSVGRRSLHLHGLAGMFLASIFLTISLLVKFLYDWSPYISLVSSLFFTFFYSIGPGPVSMVISTELFTQSSRPAAMTLALLLNWLSNFLVSLTFPILRHVMQSYNFLPYTLFLALFWIFSFKKMPETKNRTYEEIAIALKPAQLDSSSSNFLTDFAALNSTISADQLNQGPVSSDSVLASAANQQNNFINTPRCQDQTINNRFRFDDEHTMRRTNSQTKLKQHNNLGHGPLLTNDLVEGSTYSKDDHRFGHSAKGSSYVNMNMKQHKYQHDHYTIGMNSNEPQSIIVTPNRQIQHAPTSSALVMDVVKCCPSLKSAAGYRDLAITRQHSDLQQSTNTRHHQHPQPHSHSHLHHHHHHANVSRNCVNRSYLIGGVNNLNSMNGKQLTEPQSATSASCCTCSPSSATFTDTGDCHLTSGQRHSLSANYMPYDGGDSDSPVIQRKIANQRPEQHLEYELLCSQQTYNCDGHHDHRRSLPLPNHDLHCDPDDGTGQDDDDDDDGDGDGDDDEEDDDGGLGKHNAAIKDDNDDGDDEDESSALFLRRRSKTLTGTLGSPLKSKDRIMISSQRQSGSSDDLLREKKTARHFNECLENNNNTTIQYVQKTSPGHSAVL